MKYIKIYEKFDENKIKIGDILKKITIDNKHYDLFIITYTDAKNVLRDIQIYNFGRTSIDFEYTKFYATQSPYDIHRWFINDYSLLTDTETELLYKDIDKADNYYFDKIKKDIKIDLKKYPLDKNINKYNL